jgi:hypothetical protein
MDLVSGVMAAAKPTDMAVAAKKLRQPAHSNAAGGGLFNKIFSSFTTTRAQGTAKRPKLDIVADVMANAEPVKSQTAASKLERLKSGQNETNKSARREAMTRLEGVLLTNALDSILPKAGGTLYGDEVNGNIWRGLQIEKLSEALAERGPLNLAADFWDRSRAGSSTLPTGSASFDKPFSAQKITPFAFRKSQAGLT